MEDWQSSCRQCTKGENTLCRARIGRTHLTHSYILNDPPLQREYCQCVLTVRHILVECNNFAEKRKDIFGGRELVELFTFHPTLILCYLKSVLFYVLMYILVINYFYTALYTVFITL